MYKLIVSCYYWPATDGRLQLRSLHIKTNRRRLGTGLDYSRVERLTRVDRTASSIERRQAQRLKIHCDAELTANLAILDNDAFAPVDSLVFFGRTKDLSAGGLALVLPSTPIDERYCNDSTRLRVSLHLPTGSVQLEVNPVRCVPLNQEDSGRGYLMGAQILSLDDQRDEYDQFLRTVSDLKP
jgi:hypothetical protein